MLDTNKDSLKLEAMKTIVAVSGGRGRPGPREGWESSPLGSRWTFS